MKRIGSQRNLENREIEIRFMFEKKNVVCLYLTSVDAFLHKILGCFQFCTVVDDSEDESFTIGLGSKRKRNAQATSARQTSSMTSKLPLSSLRSAFPPPQPKSAAGPVRLRSAFPPIIPRPIQWTRSVNTTPYAFIRTTATFVTNGKETGQVIFKESDDTEFIEIPNRSAWEKKGTVGYIGEGFTKRGIYVCSLSWLVYEILLSFTCLHRLVSLERNM